MYFILYIYTYSEKGFIDIIRLLKETTMSQKDDFKKNKYIQRKSNRKQSQGRKWASKESVAAAMEWRELSGDRIPDLLLDQLMN